ncbi:MAG: hypothetical protein WCK09_22220 [Bacteroidota bacterium]
MAYIDYKETTPGVKTDFSVMGLDASQIEIIRTCLNSTMGELLIRRIPGAMDSDIKSKVMTLCDLFNNFNSHRMVPAATTELTQG